MSEILLKEHNINVKPDMIADIAHQNEIYGYVQVTKPKITEQHAKRRLAWAQKYKNKSEHYWLTKCLFLDESKLKIYNDRLGGNCYVRSCKRNERLLPDNVGPKIKFDGGGLNIFASVCGYGFGELQFVNGILTGEKYTEIIENSLEPTFLFLDL